MKHNLQHWILQLQHMCRPVSP